MKRQLADKDDAYGHEMCDYFNGVPVAEIVERDDRYIANSGGPMMYFNEFRKWAKYERDGMKYARGRVLDIGAGAGRVALYLQERGHQVTAIDISSLAIRVCKARGVKDARVMPIEQTHELKPGSYDTVVMYGGNLGLLAGRTKGKRLLKALHRVTTEKGRIIATGMDPYGITDQLHLVYHQRNRRRGRMSGQLRIRVRYLAYIGEWFDYLLLSKNELEAMLEGTGWVVKKYLDSPGPRYGVVMRKES